MTPLYWRAAGALIVALLVGGIGYKIGSHHWQSKYEAELAHQWQQKAIAEEVVRKTLEKQIADARVTIDNNQVVLNELTTRAASIVADRDRVRELADRLLARSTRSCPSAGRVPEADHRSTAPETSQPSGDAGLREALVAAHDECVGNADQLDALIAEIRPQL